MKRILSITGIFSLAFIFLTSFSLRENPQDPPRGKKNEKHLKLVSVDDSGKKIVLDTVIEGDDVFVWNGDTIGGAKELKWVSEGDFDISMDMDIDVKETGDGKVIIMKSGKGGAPMIQEYKIDGDSNKVYRVRVLNDEMHGDHDVMMWHSDEGNNEMIFRAPQMQGALHAPKMIRIEKGNKGNVIDLSDPGIISYDKKELKDGKEKITIIRNKPVEKDIELHKEIIMQGAGNQPMILHGGQTSQSKTVKVIKDDDGNITIFEDGKERKIKAGEGENAFISEDGNVFHVKTTKEGDKEKMEVKVEVEEEKEKK